MAQKLGCRLELNNIQFSASSMTETVDPDVGDPEGSLRKIPETVRQADLAETIVTPPSNIAMRANLGPIINFSSDPTAGITPHIAIVVDQRITIADSDANTLASATISIESGFQPGEDAFGFSPKVIPAEPFTSIGNIKVASNANGILTLTSDGATATLQQWQAALRGVTYIDNSDTPHTGARTISFTLNDGTTTGASATKQITVFQPDTSKETLFAALTPSSFGTVEPDTGQETVISNLPSGLLWPLGDAVNQSDPIHGLVFSKQFSFSTGNYILAINKADGSSFQINPPNFSTIVGYDTIGNKLIYANLGATDDLYSYDVTTNVSALIKANFSSETTWQAGGIGAVNSIARQAYLYDSFKNEVDIIDLDTGTIGTPISAPSGLIEVTLDERNQKLVGLVSTNAGLRLGAIDVNTDAFSFVSGVLTGAVESNYVQAISPDTLRYYFQSNSTIIAVSTQTGAVVKSFDAPFRLFPVAQVVLGGASDSTFETAIGDHAASVLKEGPSTVTLTGSSSYAGATTIDGGALSISSDSNLGTTGPAELKAGTALKLTATFTLMHPITVAGDPTFDVDFSKVATVSSVIADGNSAGELVKAGSGTLVLTGNNTYSGGTILKNGSIDLAASHAAGSGTITFTGPGQTVRIDNVAFMPKGSAFNFANTIDKFGQGDKIDLPGLAFTADAVAVYDATNQVLSVTSNGIKDTLSLTNPASMLLSEQPRLLRDEGGGTEVYLATSDARDFNADGPADLLVQNGTNGDIDYAKMSQGSFAGWVNVGMTPGWSVVGEGHVAGSACSDIVIQNQSGSGQIFYADLVNGMFNKWVSVGATPGWKVGGIADVNSDGFADIVVENQSTGQIAYANMANGGNAGWVNIGFSPGFSVMAIADVNFDGCADVVIQNSAGLIYWANMAGGTFRGWNAVGNTPGYSVVGAGDINRDGYADLVIQNQSNGQVLYANMNRGTFNGWVNVDSRPGWNVTAVEDVMGNGYDDIVVQSHTGQSAFADMTTGSFQVWRDIANTPGYMGKTASIADSSDSGVLGLSMFDPGSSNDAVGPLSVNDPGAQGSSIGALTMSDPGPANDPVNGITMSDPGAQNGSIGPLIMFDPGAQSPGVGSVSVSDPGQQGSDVPALTMFDPGATASPPPDLGPGSQPAPTLPLTIRAEDGGLLLQHA